MFIVTQLGYIPLNAIILFKYHCSYLAVTGSLLAGNFVALLPKNWGARFVNDCIGERCAERKQKRATSVANDSRFDDATIKSLSNEIEFRSIALELRLFCATPYVAQSAFK